DRGDQVDDPRGAGRVAVLEAEPLVGVDGGQAVEVGPPPGFRHGEPVDGLDGEQGSALSCGARPGLVLLDLVRLSLTWPGARGALEVVTRAESVLAGLGGA